MTNVAIDIPLQAEIAALVDLDKATLQQVATSEMAQADQQALDHLLDLQNIRPLNEDEIAYLEALRLDYGRILLRKARAFALLAERGIPLSFE